MIYLCTVVSSKPVNQLGVSFVCYRIFEQLPGRRGWGTCSHDPLSPVRHLLNPLLLKNIFTSCSLDHEIFLRRFLDPQKCLSLFPYLFAWFTFLFIVEKNRFRTASFFSLRSPHAVLYWLQFLSSQLSQLPLHLPWTALDEEDLKWVLWLSPSSCQHSHSLAKRLSWTVDEYH